MRIINSSYLSLIFILCCSLPSNVFAQSKHGLITSAPCPYSCQQADIPANYCREWRRGSVCEVEDLRLPAGHRTLFLKNQPIKKDFIPEDPFKNKVQNIPDGRPYQSMKSKRHGLVTSGLCPLTCQQLSIPPHQCQMWKTGNRCFVEDFRQPAGHRSLLR